MSLNWLQVCFRIYWLYNFYEKPIILKLRAVLEDFIDNLCSPKNGKEKSGRDFCSFAKKRNVFIRITLSGLGHALLFI